MGPGALVYLAAHTDRISRSYHPYHSLDSFNNLRHHLPAAISASCYSDYHSDKPWGPSPQPASVGPYMSPPYLPNDGQDASYSFQQAASHYPSHSYDTEARFNGEDPDIGSLSGDDDAEGFDSNAQLRSQQLNTDGTPKRPMNAFMIFARKRRPMVSSEQPTMRTGEISKILSKEWSEMCKEDKQFYLDQAKKLKDTFNARWPDYVYRRRPNNSRKRRKLGGISGAGLARNHEAPVNSDGQLEAFVDLNTSSPSGDESRSQSTDAFPSPLSTQPRLLYPATELHARAADRSPTPASVLAPYSRPTSAPHIQPGGSGGYTEESTLNDYASQAHRYGESNGAFYVPQGNGDAHDHPTELEPKIKNWHPFDSIPSGVVGPASTTPPCSSPLLHLTPQTHHSQVPCPPHTPNNWSTAAPTNDTHPYEAQSTIWGASPLVAGHHGGDSQGINAGLLSTSSSSHAGFVPTGSPDPNALGLHPYDREKNPFEDNHYQPAYMEAGRFNHIAPGSHSSLVAQPFPDGLTASHNDSPSVYFGSAH